MNEKEILKVINYLIGNITPIGDEAADQVAMENIEKLVFIMKELYLKIDRISALKDNGYNSKKQVIKLANDYLDWLGIEE